MLLDLVLLINFFFTSLFVIIATAFLTLLERKILGFIQYRYGPNKVGILGILQPFSDGLKLFCKSEFKLLYSSGFKYMIMPLSMFVIMLMLWGVLPFNSLINKLENGGLLIICLLSVGVFPVMWGSWFSLSIYSMLGSLRCVAQMISYEVNMIMIMVGFYLFIGSFNIVEFSLTFTLGFMFPYTLLFFFSMLMELNRSPSDLIEGESELVSGFNTEFYGVNFSFIFLGEYGSILFMSGFFVIMILGLNTFSFFGIFLLLIISMLIIIIRGFVPRFRYDNLMLLCWTSGIFLTLGYFILIIGIFCILW